MSVIVFLTPYSIAIPPVVTVDITIPISWTSSGQEVDRYIVMWERDTSGECPDVDIGSYIITDGSTDYIIRDVEEDSRYFIVVQAMNNAGSADSFKIIGVTRKAG